ncbi:hypothetical protein BC629DRAFT_1551371 [Irpex lacteus]|nr:hypothetical protein BC629DRAFT_1551371 [Irpex lacteus]
MVSNVANDARSTADPGGTLETPTTDSAVAPTRTLQDAPPQERGVDVDTLFGTASRSSPQASTGADDAAVSTVVETSSSGMGAVDLFPAPPRLSSASDPIPSPRSSLVGDATVPTVVETNSSGDDAPSSHSLSNDSHSGHPQDDGPTGQALVKTGSSDSGIQVVDVHGTTSLRGVSGAHISGQPQESGASKQVTAAAAGEASSSNTYAASPAFAPLGLLSARSSTPTRGSTAVDDRFVPAAVDASSDGTSAVDIGTTPALHGLSHPSPSHASVSNHTIPGPVVKGSSIPHSAAECSSADQLQEVAELLKHAGNLLSRLGSSHAHHVHVCKSDCKCTVCDCACAQNPQPCPSVSGATGDARAVSAAAATPAPATATSGRGGAPVNQAADSQDRHSSTPPPKDPQDTQQPSSAAQQAPSGPQALPGQLTGWAAVEKALKEFDQQEIGGYKEDIDSLLTFVSFHLAVSLLVIIKLICINYLYHRLACTLLSSPPLSLSPTLSSRIPIKHLLPCPCPLPPLPPPLSNLPSLPSA